MPLENKDIVKKYHEKLTTIRVRVPAPDVAAGIPDYPQISDICYSAGCHCAVQHFGAEVFFHFELHQYFSTNFYQRRVGCRRVLRYFNRWY